jgi:hypothetical protein
MGEDLQRISAQAVRPTPYPDSVTTSNIRHGSPACYLGRDDTAWRVRLQY